jgi:hypothetical protein
MDSAPKRVSFSTFAEPTKTLSKRRLVAQHFASEILNVSQTSQMDSVWNQSRGFARKTELRPAGCLRAGHRRPPADPAASSKCSIAPKPAQHPGKFTMHRFSEQQGT